MGQKLKRSKWLLAIAFLILGLIIGFYFGSMFVVHAVASIAGGFIDEEKVYQALFQYNNHINECYPANFSNAPILSDTGN